MPPRDSQCLDAHVKIKPQMFRKTTNIVNKRAIIKVRSVRLKKKKKTIGPAAFYVVLNKEKKLSK